jgi:hypothetical protein
MQDDRTFGKTLLLLAFWAYVLIPLGTGIWSTPGQGPGAVQLNAGPPVHRARVGLRSGRPPSRTRIA